jgi:tetratricopeptide (TPR) repeat protein
MDSNDISILIGRIEREADDNLKLHLAKAGLVTALGFLPLALLALGALTGFIKLIYFLIVEGRGPLLPVLLLAACIAGLLVLVRALAIPGEVPGGREITAEDAPALFEAIEDVIERMAFIKKGNVIRVSIESVTLDGSFEAKLHQVPQWGAFGRYENHLRLGVPLLAALSIAELKAVLAHELGHLGSERDQFAAWLYRQRMAWRLLQQKFERPTTTSDRVLAKFYAWHATYFQAYTFVLARNLEYAADRAAAKATHPGAVANALTKIVLMRRFLEEEFWPRLMNQVEAAPEPPYLPYSMMPRAFSLALKHWSRQDWLDRSLRTLPSAGDTHPSLGERFEALNIQPAPPTYSADRSSLSLFGPDAPKMLKWCDDMWRKENGPLWRQRHKAIGELRWKIAEYEKVAPADANAEDLWQKTMLILELGELPRAIEELQYLIAREPKMAKAQLLLGKLLLQCGDEQGLQNLQLAAQQDAQMVEDAGGAGYNYLMDRGRKGEAQRFWDRVAAA